MPGDLQNWWLFAGKLHPLVVHFPIALLIVAAGLEFFRFRRGERRPGRGAMACLILGAVSAALAAVVGWSNAITAGHQGSDAWVLSPHRWAGVATAAAAAGAVLLAIVARARNTGRPFAWYRLSVIVSAVLVGLAGHFGGSLIYGTDYLPLAWSKAMNGGDGSRVASGSVTAAALTRPIDFSADVQPILARRCYQCHAGDKPESGLSLDRREGALKGGKSGHPAVV